MRRFRNLSIRRKQTLIISLTSGLALLLACAAFVTFDLLTFRRELTEKMSTFAEITGNNCTGALDFNVANSAEEALRSLRAEPTIASACIYDRNGHVFAEYRRDGTNAAVEMPAVQAGGHKFAGKQLQLFRVIRLDKETIGTIYLASDLYELRERLERYATIVGLVFVASLIVALILSSGLQRLISDPILHLAKFTRSVAKEKNYSVRATKRSEDELGQLIDGFNEMLGQIQERDGALQAARDQLEHRVEARTGELASSVSLLNATLEASVDGILAVNLEGKITTHNKRFAELWRFSGDVLARCNVEELAALAVRQLKDSKVFLARVEQLETSPERENFDVLEFQDGRAVERISRPQYIGDKCVGSVMTYRDITERKQADEVLRRTEALYRSAIAGAGAVPYSFDFKTRSYVFMGEGIQQLIGYAPHEVSGTLWKQIIQKSVMLGEAAGLDKDEAARRVTAGELRSWRCDMCVTTRDGETRWVSDASVQNLDESGRPSLSMGILQDITERKRAEEELKRTHGQLLETSRAAGMAEVATSVLHNVGNVLNSVNTSASVVADRLKHSKSGGVARIVELLEQNRANLAGFFTTEGRADQVINYLKTLAQHLAYERTMALNEMQELAKNIEHIKEIVAMQQSYARVAGVTEKIKATELVEDALRMNEAALERHQVQLVRQYAPQLPEITVDKHKVLQILVNLIRNAKYACDDSGSSDKRLTVSITNGGERMRIAVADNGVGIPAENLTRIFAHGFTTRKEGHGFGLHSGALAAREMGGTLLVHSDGPGKGAEFTLEFPYNPPGHATFPAAVLQQHHSSIPLEPIAVTL